VSDARVALWLGALVSTFLLVFHHAGLAGSDEYGVYEQTASLARRGDLAVPPIENAFVGRDGRYYSISEVGQSVLAVPFYSLGALVEDHGPSRLTVLLSGPGVLIRGRVYRTPTTFAVLLLPILLTGVLAAVFFLFERLLDVSHWWAAAAALAATLTTYIAYMSGFFLSHTAETTAILAAFYCFARFARGGRRFLLPLGSGLASLSFLIRLPVAVVAVSIAGYLVWVLDRRYGWPGSAQAWRQAATWRAIGSLAAPVAAALGVYVAVNYWRWGSLMESPMMAERARFSTPLSVSGVANLFGPGSSVFLYSPLLVLVPWLCAAGWRTERALIVTGLANFAVFWLFCSRYDSWTGLWSAPGPRYLTATIPLLLLPLGPWLQLGGPGRRRLFALLCALGLTIQVALLATSWPELIHRAGYRAMGSREFPFAFLFVPEASPVLWALRLFVQGEANGTWLFALAWGWPGFEGAPAAAWSLVAVWLLALLLIGRRLWTALRPHPGGSGADVRETSASPRPFGNAPS
jgi:hypothetical protein